MLVGGHQGKGLSVDRAEQPGLGVTAQRPPPSCVTVPAPETLWAYLPDREILEGVSKEKASTGPTLSRPVVGTVAPPTPPSEEDLGISLGQVRKV